MAKRDVIGVPWFEPHNYRRCIEVMTDAELLPETYEDWLDHGVSVLDRIEREGLHPVKVVIDPIAFSSWCRTMRLNADGVARARLARIIATDTHLRAQDGNVIAHPINQQKEPNEIRGRDR